MEYFRKLSAELADAPGLYSLILSATGIGFVFGGMLPLISLWLESLGVGFNAIGMVSGMSALGIVVSAYFAPFFARRFGIVKTVIIGLLLTAITMVVFRYVDGFFMWLLTRFLCGLGLGLHWVLSEAWLAKIVSEKGRTRAMALYATALSLGFAAGPMVVLVFGFTTPVPFYVSALLVLLAAVPMILLRNLEPDMNIKKMGSPLMLIRYTPTIAAACMVAGAVDLALISLLPAMVARMPDAVPSLAILLVPAMGLGNVILQYPIATLADKYGLRLVSVIIASVGIILCSLAPFFLWSFAGALTLTFFGAGFIYGLYTIALAMVSKRFSKGEIVAANAGFVILFEFANLVGPTVAGAMVDYNLRYGLPVFMMSVGIIYAVISFLRRGADKSQ